MIAAALEGMGREAAARIAGMDRQTVRDWVIRYNRGGPAGLSDHWCDGQRRRLAEGQQATLKAIVLTGTDPEIDGVSTWRLVDLCGSASASTTRRTDRASCCTGSICPGRRRGRSIPRLILPRRSVQNGGFAASLAQIEADHPEAARIELPHSPAKPRRFRDQRPYSDWLEKARVKSAMDDSVAVAHGIVDGQRAVVAAIGFAFMDGSMGAGVGAALVTAA